MSQSSERQRLQWNPYNKVVQDEVSGEVNQELTDIVRADLGLPVPWHPGLANAEQYTTEVHYTKQLPPPADPLRNGLR
jgi:hypothetical protein